jgi:hypothetical protein
MSRRSALEIERTRAIYTAFRARYPAPAPKYPKVSIQSIEALQKLMTRQSPPRLPSRPPTINGRRAVRGEIF